MGLEVGNTGTSRGDEETSPNMTNPQIGYYLQISFDCCNFHVSGIRETAPEAASTIETGTLQGEDVSKSGAAATTERTSLQIAEEMVNSYEFNEETRVSTFTVPAGVTDVQAMRALNEYFRKYLPEFNKDAVFESDFDWYEKLPETYPDYCDPRDYTQARQITITGVVKGTEGKKRSEEADVLSNKSLDFADPRDQAIAAALHACTHDGEDLFQELSVRGSVPEFVLLTIPRCDEYGISGTPVTVGQCFDNNRNSVAASGSPSKKSK